LDLPWWAYIVVALVLTHITTLCITLFFHRAQAHRALDLHPIVSHFCRFWLWFTTSMVTKRWVAVHRKHHAYCETENDPHSPHVYGIKQVFWLGAELYGMESKNKETLERFGAGTPDDWLERNLYTPRDMWGIIILLALELLLFGVPGLAIWSVQMMWSPMAAAGVVNGIGHFWGYRNFECKDASTNVSPLGILLCGEELHNNHHTYGTSAKFSVRWFEFDLGWVYIKLLSYLKLAKPKRIPPTPHLLQYKDNIDLDTVKAVFLNRFEVMAHYAREVIAPVWSQERNHSLKTLHKDLGRRIKRLLIREQSLVDAATQQRLAEALSLSPSLQVVYEFRNRFQAIWEQTSASQKELLDALQAWCKEAEATGIEALKNFAQSLQRYTLAAS
ncbi:MAG TPA: fatty acid desaturase, partial [Gammaproteobacteria bacterium]|nr:fatty acid desaturase [Gammaproteobacteria bacterium]